MYELEELLFLSLDDEGTCGTNADDDVDGIYVVLLPGTGLTGVGVGDGVGVGFAVGVGVGVGVAVGVGVGVGVGVAVRSGMFSVAASVYTSVSQAPISLQAYSFPRIAALTFDTLR